MSPYTTLYKKAEVHVTEMFQKLQPAHLVFHNLEHTENVVRKVNEIAGHYNLSEEDMMIVYIAAWFHDTGYLLALYSRKRRARNQAGAGRVPRRD